MVGEPTAREHPNAWHDALARLGFSSYQGHLLVILGLILALYIAVAGTNVLAMVGEEEAEQGHLSVISQPVDDVQAMENWFRDHDYDLDLEAPGGRLDVPPIFVRSFPPGFRDGGDVGRHKERFVEVMLPLVLKENARLRRERAGLVALQRKIDRGTRLRPDEKLYLKRLSVLYNAPAATPEALMPHVDEIPVSLALAQSAEELGWGRSRFVREGNALFGQWTYNPDDEGIVPGRRVEGAKHRIRAFPSLRYSVRTYMRNLNSHRAYRAFRDRRAEMRKQGRPLSGVELASTLIRYSQRGQDYVHSITAIIEANNLMAYRSARLRP